MNKIKMIFWFRKIGFTLTEILIVVVIVAVLATLALPMFVKTIEKAKVGEAVSNLNLIKTGQKIYFLENGFFSNDIASLNIENPNSASSRYFDYATQKAGTDDFEGSAVRRGDAPSPYSGQEYTIGKDGEIEGPLI
jgi:prepilin-type N-terminal cleavage/methylation domain-containing protein